MATAHQRERILDRPIEDEMKESFLDYSMSVIVQRALPDVRDGLKPVHRRILFAMHELGLRPDRPYKKSATVVGDVLGKYHPHGDSAVYDAMVRMVQEFSLRYPLVDGQGNFGSIDGDSAAAYRYTEARLARVAESLLDDIDQETVDFADNFDGRLQEPVVLPGRIPGLLVNGSSGIAVGMSTNVPPHNLREVAAAVKQLAIDPDCTVDDLMRHLPGPDFPTGGFVVGRDGIRDMYREGRGRVVMRARVVKEALRGGKSQLVVTEIPYATSKSKIIEQIVTLTRKGKVDEISDLRDESDRDGLRLVIELKRGADASRVLRALYKKTYLQATFGAIMLALDRGQPREMDLKQILQHYLDHRIEVVQRRSRFQLEKAEAERHIVQGLLAALDHIDEVIRIIRGAKDRPEASEKLQDRFGLSEIQADAILNMRLGKLTRLERNELKARLEELMAQIEELRDILGSDERQIEVVLEELNDVVQAFGDERRTEILEEATEEIQEVEEEVADEDVVVTVSHEGFVKRMPMHLYRRRLSSGKALAGMERYEDDWIEGIFVARTQGWILAFTEEGQCHFLPVLELPESGRASRGQSVYSLLPGAERGDRIVSMVPVDDLEETDRVLVFVSQGGLVKRTALEEFSNPRSTGLIAAGVQEGDRILAVALSDGTAEVMLLSREGRAIRFAETDVPVQGRTARGVKGIALEDTGAVVGVLLLRRDAAVLTLSEDGSGKRTPASDFPVQKRGGQGTLVGSGGTSPIVAALEVAAEDGVMVITAAGAVTRAAASDIPLQGRRTQGRRVVKVAAGDRVVEVTRAVGSEPRRDTGEDGGDSPQDASGNGASPPAASDPPASGPETSGGAAPADTSRNPDRPAPGPDGGDASPDDEGRGEGQLDLLGE
ncbi:MAG TPA: DNA gyrase subunit A [Longimicrobiales bacterium]|nr:DNA gyrase subunit A [Longimicrobiales bacterium]